MPRRHEDEEVAKEIARRIGGRVRAARSNLQLTQEELAERIGITSEALGRIERGNASPSLPTLERLCGALGVSPDGLLAKGEGVAGARASKVDSAAQPKGRELRQILRFAATLGEPQQRIVLAVAREFARGGSGR